jgi:hypothetical protein
VWCEWYRECFSLSCEVFREFCLCLDDDGVFWNPIYKGW